MLSFTPKGIDEYTEAHSTPVGELFHELAKATQAQTDLPQMQVGSVEGTFLKLIARALQPKRIVEIGTFTGYSALMMADGAPDDCEIITCDVSHKYTDIAKAHWAKNPNGKKITLMLGSAIDSLDAINEPIDLVFIDADKENYSAYWEKCIPKVRTGGLVLADNVLWSGDVLDPKDAEARALAAFNDHVVKDDRVDAVMLTIRDGITMACKR